MLNSKSRAQIFLPYDALKGFRNCLHSKEIIKVEEKELSDDQKAELDWKIQMIESGKMIEVIYYDGVNYVKKEGMVVYIDRQYKQRMRIVDEEIAIANIINIQGEGIE